MGNFGKNVKNLDHRYGIFTQTEKGYKIIKTYHLKTIPETNIRCSDTNDNLNNNNNKIKCLLTNQRNESDAMNEVEENE